MTLKIVDQFFCLTLHLIIHHHTKFGNKKKKIGWVVQEILSRQNLKHRHKDRYRDGQSDSNISSDIGGGGIKKSTCSYTHTRTYTHTHTLAHAYTLWNPINCNASLLLFLKTLGAKQHCCAPPSCSSSIHAVSTNLSQNYGIEWELHRYHCPSLEVRKKEKKHRFLWVHRRKKKWHLLTAQYILYQCMKK